jgi:predicted adenine nucleotide alpha hydrolase (AANH) superfamily ATPase
VFYYNPNIAPRDEFLKRLGEQRRLLAEMALPRGVGLIAPEYDHAEFLAVARGFEDEPEGGERCRRCFALRLRATAKAARDGGFEAIASTITTGPNKRAADVNAAGLAAAEEFGVEWVAADFKKKDGYKMSIELSKKYGLYRQSFCGCEFGGAR